ncbi:hypothetical protein CBL_07243 [Carabus blaptoides fortunei]
MANFYVLEATKYFTKEQSFIINHHPSQSSGSQTDEKSKADDRNRKKITVVCRPELRLESPCTRHCNSASLFEIKNNPGVGNLLNTTNSEAIEDLTRKLTTATFNDGQQSSQR